MSAAVKIVDALLSDKDFVGKPITGVRFNDKKYTFYPYIGPTYKDGKMLGYIKTAKGKLHGGFRMQGQWFIFEPGE